jgi:hypothetical protein
VRSEDGLTADDHELVLTDDVRGSGDDVLEMLASHVSRSPR